MNGIVLVCKFAKSVLNMLNQVKDTAGFIQEHRESFNKIWKSIKEFGGTLCELTLDLLGLKVVAKDKDSADKLQEYFESKEFLDALNKWLSEISGNPKIEVKKVTKFVRINITSKKSFQNIRRESEKALNQETYHVESSKTVSCFFRHRI